ncbi:uncharacterized protein LOC130763326 isoform X5 [Actinidia eriantha]|uniref:uncharacterized protein LOC130763326 isoform X5 n=1 Tax=Actinidia eriantha TaxID=165200 RepID=UPI0025899F40|nr:uncharacterized protein LOC130763326 isoform X5 [Actinidia eriantha]
MQQKLRNMADYNRSCEDYIATQDQEGASTVKKYGGLVPKKKPLISKDHERAFFDSADWALCKRTPHQQLPLEDRLVLLKEQSRERPIERKFYHLCN